MRVITGNFRQKEVREWLSQWLIGAVHLEELGLSASPPPPEYVEQERAVIAHRRKQMNVGSETKELGRFMSQVASDTHIASLKDAFFCLHNQWDKLYHLNQLLLKCKQNIQTCMPTKLRSREKERYGIWERMVQRTKETIKSVLLTLNSFMHNIQNIFIVISN